MNEIADFLATDPLEELDASDEVKAAVRAVMARDEHRDVIVDLILATTGTPLPCPAVYEFISQNGWHESHHEAASTFFSHRFNKAAAQSSLARFQDHDFIVGVEIIPGRQCKHSKLKFQWSEISALPRIPCGWGCTCCYTAIIDDRD